MIDAAKHLWNTYGGDARAAESMEAGHLLAVMKGGSFGDIVQTARWRAGRTAGTEAVLQAAVAKVEQAVSVLEGWRREPPEK